MTRHSSSPPKLQARFLTFMIIVGFVLLQQPLSVFSAAFSTGGTSSWAPMLLWLTWGTPNGPANDPGTAGVALANGASTSAVMEIGGQTLQINCTLGNVKGRISSYAPGTNPGDGLDNMYNIGGPNSANILVNGIINTRPAEKVSFDITCSATLGGLPFELPGFVFGDAEQLTGKDNITITGDGYWYVVDRTVGGTCTGRDYYASLNGAGTTVTFQAGELATTLCPTPNDPANFGPTGGGVLQFAPSAYQGTNRQVTATISLAPDKVDPTTGNTGFAAMAIGLLPYNIDTSDAAGYTGAANFFEVGLSMGSMEKGANKNIMPADFILSEPVPPTEGYLGSTIDADGWDVVPNAAADSDDTHGPLINGVLLNDEDGITGIDSLDLVQAADGQTIYQLQVSCAGDGGYVNGWIDWNRNYSFDSVGKARNGPVACTNGLATLEYTIPTDSAIVPGPSYFRLRYAWLMEDVLSPVGLADFGEVEDHLMPINPELSIDKTITSTGPYDVKTNNLINFQVVVKNTGNLGLTGVTISDPNLTNFTCNTALPAQLLLGAEIVCHGTHTVVQSDVDAGSYVNTATADSLQTNPVSDTETVTFLQDPKMVLTKTETSSEPYNVTTNSEITYEIKIENTGNITLNNITLNETTGTLTGCTPALTDPLAPEASIVCSATHTVTQLDVDNGNYANQVTAQSARTAQLTATETVEFEQLPAMTVTKTVTNNGGNTVGNDITYAISMYNSGNITLNGLTLTDNRATIGSDCAAKLAVPLPPLSSVTCNASHTITQADMDAGRFTNTAEGDSTRTNPETSAATVLFTQLPNQTFTKTVTSTGPYALNSVIMYDLVATNTGNITLTHAHIEDDKATILSCSPENYSSLAPQETMTCKASYKVTQNDVNVGSLTNTASIHSDQAGLIEASTTTPITQIKQMSLTKTRNPGGPYVVGDSISYSLVLTNTGTVTLTDARIVDSDTTFGQCTPANPTTLQPSESLTCTVAHLVTQNDFDAGHYLNQAISYSDQVPSVIAQAEDVIFQTSPAIQVLKQEINRDPAVPYEAGYTIEYGIWVTNAGDVTLTSVTLTDANATLSLPCQASETDPTPVSVPVTRLEVGTSFYCTAAYTLTQADIDRQVYTNTAIANSSETNAVSSSVDSQFVPDPDVLITKTVTTSGTYKVGDNIGFNLKVDNLGNNTLENLVLTDSNATLACTIPAGFTLAPNESFTCGATHAVTQDDINAGSVLNTGIVTADVLGSAPTITISDQSTVTAIVPQTTRMTFTKTETTTGPYHVNSEVLFDLVVSNTGTVTLFNVNVSDPGAQVSGCTLPTTLQPGESITCLARHTIVQSEVDGGSHTNFATATSNQTPPLVREVTVAIAQNPAVSISKTLVSNADSLNGDAVFTVIVTNTGDTTLHDVDIADPTAALTGCTLPIDLAPLATLTCTATHTITQTDIDIGTYVNTATVSSHQVPDKSAAASVRLTQTPQFTFTKRDDNPTKTNYLVGEKITYSIQVRNSGNMTLEEITFADPNATHNCVVPSDMAPGAVVDCQAEHIVTQADLNRGSVLNVATVDSNQTPPLDAEARTTLQQNPSVLLQKAVYNTADAPFTVDETIVFSLYIENNGNVTLGNPIFRDDTATFDHCDIPTTQDLQPGENTTCYFNHLVTQADINAGQLVNMAYLTTDMTPETGSSVTVTFERNPLLTVSKREVSSGPYVLNSVIEYEVVIRNEGNVTLTGLNVVSANDPLQDCTPALVTLDPLTASNPATITCKAFHTVTQQNIDDGSYKNTATIDADQVNAVTADTTVTFQQSPAMSVTKSITNPADFEPGQTIAYDITVTNTGNVTLHGVGLDDQNATFTPDPCVDFSTTLAPLASFTCPAEHTLTQLEYDSGSYTNTAIAESSLTVPVSSTAAVSFNLERSMSVALTLTSNGPYAVGDSITYQIVASNEALASLNHVYPGMTDADIISCDKVLPVTLGAHEMVTCQAEHVVTQDDIDAGSLVNQVSVTALELTTPMLSNEITVNLAATLSLDKQVTSVGPYRPGDSITYQLTAENVGDVIINNVVITDTRAVVSGCSIPEPVTLAPQDQLTCTATHELVEADFDQDNYVNMATVVSDETPAPVASSVTTNLSKGLTIDKIVTSTGAYLAGDSVTYDIIVTNLSSVTQTNVTVDDQEALISTCQPALPASLGPGAKLICEAAHELTQAEVDSENYTNTATAVSDQNTPIQDTVTTSLLKPLLTFKFTVLETTYTGAGQLLHFSYLITNEGTGIAHEVTVTDSLGTAINCPSDQLPAGQSMTCTGVYVTTPADVNARAVVNTASLTSVETTALSAMVRIGATIIEQEEEESDLALKLDPLKIPQTGFEPGVTTLLPEQNLKRQYQSTGGVILSIPKLNQRMEVLGIPKVDGTWDVSWLGSRAGYLTGTAFPSTPGNSVLVGHVVNAIGSAGPFANLQSLSWGDQVIVEAFGQQYVYEVRESLLVEPTDFSVMAKKDKTWLTLITCKDFDAATKTYNARIVVQAVLVEVR